MHSSWSVAAAACPLRQASSIKRAVLCHAARDIFDTVLSGIVEIEIEQTSPLKEAAHRDLESRKTIGSSVLTVRQFAVQCQSTETWASPHAVVFSDSRPTEQD